MAKIIAVMNEKGGTGKTTTATALSYLLAKRGYKVLHIDFDGQGHSTIILSGKNPNKIEITIYTIIRNLIEDEPLPAPDSYIIKTECGVDLIPSNSQLFTLERNLCNANFRERILSRYTDTIKDSYDFIIIDCMPQMGTPMINVMMCADSLIIPTQAELLSVQGLTELLKHYEVIRKNSNHGLRIEGILITMDSLNTRLSAQVKELIYQGFADTISIFEATIPRSVKVGEAALYSNTICEHLPNNPAAIAYNHFVEELLFSINKNRKELSDAG